MWLWKQDKVSSRKQIQIKGVRDNILILPNNEYRVVLETSSVNFELKSEAEQDVLIDSFENFLNSLNSKLQILIRVREVDVETYVKDILKLKTLEKEKVYQNQIENYADFIKNLVVRNKILARKFFLVIPYQAEEKSKDFRIIKEQLQLLSDIVIKALEKLGMKARRLETIEILDLFYSFYNPDQIKSELLTKNTLEKMLEEKYV